MAVFSCLALAATSAWAGTAPMSLRLLRSLAQGPRVHAWVFFTDKQLSTPALRAQALDRAQAALTPRALWRRSKTMSGPRLVDELDVPVSSRYVGVVLSTGARRRAVSRWINAMSVEATAEQLRAIAALPFVARLDLVASSPRDPATDIESRPVSDLVIPGAGGSRAAGGPMGLERTDSVDSTQYGVTWKQLNQIQIPAMHALGYHGEGVLICMLDDGYKLTHTALTYPGHPMQVAHSRDFINGDTIVVNQAGQDSAFQDEHGTWTSSVIGGYYPGRYLGAAYEARFLLGKTEVYPSESKIEEDYWCMGAEWADSLGADVISSSLGYKIFDDTSTDYHYWNMDGRQAISSQCAVEAARRGIVVVVAMGNDGNASPAYPDPLNKMGAPGDADSVISAGAVDSNSVRVGFSSVGPTYDRRIKPDVMARGVRAWVPSYSDNQAYAQVNGTSFSTPLTAGAAALLVQAHPSWTPWDVMSVMHMTGSQSSNPDTLYGWGLLHTLDASNAVAPSGVAGGAASANAVALRMAQNQPNPFRGLTRIDYALSAASAAGRVALRIYDPQGRRIATLVDGPQSAGLHHAAWDGRDAGGRAAAAGVYFYRLEAGGSTVTRRLVLLR